MCIRIHGLFTRLLRGLCGCYGPLAVRVARWRRVVEIGVDRTLLSARP